MPCWAMWFVFYMFHLVMKRDALAGRNDIFVANAIIPIHDTVMFFRLG